jgi:hypothetical protein
MELGTLICTIVAIALLVAIAIANGRTAHAKAAASAPVATPSVEDRLKRLDQLKASGAITDQEHAARRQAIVEEL